MSKCNMYISTCSVNGHSKSLILIKRTQWHHLSTECSDMSITGINKKLLYSDQRCIISNLTECSLPQWPSLFFPNFIKSTYTYQSSHADRISQHLLHMGIYISQNANTSIFRKSVKASHFQIFKCITDHLLSYHLYF